MKNLLAAALVSVLSGAGLAAAPALAADQVTEIRVALLDMTSNLGEGPVGANWGAMRHGMSGQGGGRFGPGWGMMGRGGMMGYGPMAIRIDHATAKAGEVRFHVTNWSLSIIHEMIVVAVDNADAPLPYDPATERVREDQVKILGEAGEMQPNGSRDLDVKLAPGSYLLFCNVPGHYAAGMVASLTVTP